jgi:uncharacterized damage-inducible protein DinB
MRDRLTRQWVLEELAAARQELMRSLMFLSEEEATQLSVHGDWCVRDVISHIAARECVVLAAVRHLLEDGDPRFRSAGEDREFNMAAVERRREFSLADVVDELGGIRQYLLHRVRQLAGEVLSTPYAIGATGETQSIGQMLLELADHDCEHAAGIWEWRARQGLLFRDEFRYLVATARHELLNALGGLHEDDMVSEPVCGEWTVQQVMAHVLSWDEEALRTVEHWTKDRPWQEEVVYDDDWNEAAVAERADLDVIDLADGLATYHRKLLQRFDALGDEELVVMAQAPWGPRMALISFYADMAEHDRSHAPELAELRARLQEYWEAA